MKLTNKLALLIAVLTLAACGNSVQQETLANGDILELATASNVEKTAASVRIYNQQLQLRAQEVVLTNSVTGDVIRSVIPVATGQLIARNTAITVQDMKNDAPAGSPAVVNNVQGAQAVANAEQVATSASQTQTLGPCGLPVCPTLGSID